MIIQKNNIIIQENLGVNLDLKIANELAAILRKALIKVILSGEISQSGNADDSITLQGLKECVEQEKQLGFTYSMVNGKYQVEKEVMEWLMKFLFLFSTIDSMSLERRVVAGVILKAFFIRLT